MASADGPGTFRKVTIKKHAKLPQRITAENRYWRTFKTVALEQQISAVTSVAFSPASPNEVAVTSSTRVLIYDATSARVKKQISKFKVPPLS
eukprot:SAG31_NODE_576_length_13956_cov_10.311828_5_plen_92_part_00